jgi:hypothetical protein
VAQKMPGADKPNDPAILLRLSKFGIILIFDFDGGVHDGLRCAVVLGGAYASLNEFANCYIEDADLKINI